MPPTTCAARARCPSPTPSGALAPDGPPLALTSGQRRRRRQVPHAAAPAAPAAAQGPHTPERASTSRRQARLRTGGGRGSAAKRRRRQQEQQQRASEGVRLPRSALGSRSPAPRARQSTAGDPGVKQARLASPDGQPTRNGAEGAGSFLRHLSHPGWGVATGIFPPPLGRPHPQGSLARLLTYKLARCSLSCPSQDARSSSRHRVPSRYPPPRVPVT